MNRVDSQEKTTMSTPDGKMNGGKLGEVVIRCDLGKDVPFG